MFDWLAQLFGRDRNVLNEQQLATLISGLHRAASSSLDVAGEQHSRLIEQYFSPLEGGALEARKILLKIDEEKYMFVPLISLVPPVSYRLNAIRMRISVKLTKGTLQRVKTVGATAFDSQFVKVVVPPHSYTKGKGKDYVDIILDFRADEPPETVKQLLNVYSNSISVKTADDEKGLPIMDYAKSKQFTTWLESHQLWKKGSSQRVPRLNGLTKWFQKIPWKRRH